MAGTRSHDYHILPPNPWPILGAFAGLAFAGGAILYMHATPYGGWAWAFGVACVLAVMRAGGAR